MHNTAIRRDWGRVRTALTAVAVLALPGCGGDPIDSSATTPPTTQPGRTETTTSTSPQPETASAPQSIDIGRGGPHQVVSGDGFLWVASTEANVSKIDPLAPSLVDTLEARGVIAFGEGSLWVGESFSAASGGPVLKRVDPTSAAVTATIPLPLTPQSVAAGGGRIWVAATEFSTGRVFSIDPKDPSGFAPVAQVQASSPGGPSSLGIVYGADSVWTVSGGDGLVTRISPVDGRVTATIDTGASCRGSTFAAGSLWVACGNNLVYRINPTTNQVTDTISVSTPQGLAGTDDTIYAASYDRDDPQVIGIDAATNETQTVHMIQGPRELTVAEGSLWITSTPSDSRCCQLTKIPL